MHNFCKFTQLPQTNFPRNLHKPYTTKYFFESEFIIIDAYSGGCELHALMSFVRI